MVAGIAWLTVSMYERGLGCREGSKSVNNQMVMEMCVGGGGATVELGIHLLLVCSSSVIPILGAAEAGAGKTFCISKGNFANNLVGIFPYNVGMVLVFPI